MRFAGASFMAAGQGPVRRLLGALATRWRLRRCASVGPGAVARGYIWVHGRGSVHVGAGVVLDGSHHPIELHAVEKDSQLFIGDGALVSGGVSIESVVSVHLGARSRLGGFSRVMDNNFHPLVGDRLVRPPSSPVRIGDDVEIGPRAILLAGSQVGSGATVGPATVISRRSPVPDGASASGMPAVIA